MIDKDTLKKYMSDLQQCINSTVEYIDMKKELSRFLYDDFYKGNTFLYSMQMYKRIVGWFYIINYMKNYKISDLNWNVICELHNSNFNDKLSEAIRYYKRKEIGVSIKRLFKYYEKKKLMVGHLDFYDILNKFYLLLCNNVRYKSMKNIKEVNEYKHLLLNYSNYESLTIETDNEYLNLERNILSNFPLESNYNEVIQVEYYSTKNKDSILNANFNIRTGCKFIRNILTNFLLSYNKSERLQSKEMRIFIYYFVESLGEKRLERYEDIDEQTFNLQYKFYQKMDNDYRKKKLIINVKKLQQNLVAFYRYFINRLEELDYNNVFCKSFKQVIYSKSFYKYYEKGFCFVYHNRLELPPESDKYCVLPSIQTLLNSSGNNYRIAAINLENVPQKYKNDVKNFIWKIDGDIRTTNTYMYKLIEFLNFKVNHDQLYVNIALDLNNSYKEFSEDFLWDFRSTIENTVKSNGHLKGILKIVRKYMKCFKDKYNVTENDLDILNLKGLGKFDGGTPISEKDASIIYKQFEKQESIVQNGRLYTILYEIFMLTNLRIGEIYNLRRDCLNKEKEHVKLKYLSKTSNKEFVMQNISENVAALIDEAINLTEPYISGNDIMAQYIFVEPYRAKHVTKVKRINFYRYFKAILKAVREKLEIKDYFPYNIRHTFINSVYKMGVQNNLSINKITSITGNSYKTANMYYRKYSEIELYVEAMAKVTISDVDIYGNILEVEKENKYKVVKKNLGKCKNGHCTFDVAECLMCRSFVTFINRIPYFEQQILEYNKIIEKSFNPIEIKELSIQKKLLGKFLAEMYKMQKLKG